MTLELAHLDPYQDPAVRPDLGDAAQARPKPVS
jgi:hypothetical protein